MSALIDRIFVLVFAVLLVAPLLQMATRLVPEPAVEEMRESKTLPALLPRLTAMDASLSTDVNGWFNDRFGFRSVLIRLKNEIDYDVFGTSEKVIVGRDGWLFNKAGLSAIVSDAADSTLDQKIVDTLRGLAGCLAERQVRLVFVMNASKSALYRQFLPAPPDFDPPTRLSRRLAGRLRHDRAMLFIDGEGILSAHKNDMLFYKTDVHMNLKAASYVYRELVRQIALTGGQPAPFLAPESWSVFPGEGGSEAQFFAKFLPFDDTRYWTPSVDGALTSDQFGTFQNNVGSSGVPTFEDLPLYDWIFKNTRPAASLLPPTMLFGTSFSDGMFSLRYNEVFETIYRTRSNVPERIGPLLLHMPGEVRILILEFPEHLLNIIPRLGQSPDRKCGVSSAG